MKNPADLDSFLSLPNLNDISPDNLRLKFREWSVDFNVTNGELRDGDSYLYKQVRTYDDITDFTWSVVITEYLLTSKRKPLRLVPTLMYITNKNIYSLLLLESSAPSDIWFVKDNREYLEQKFFPKTSTFCKRTMWLIRDHILPSYTSAQIDNLASPSTDFSV